jgi:hemolysin type calcium-binding protein
MVSSRRILFVAGLAVAACLALPGISQAAVTCSFSSATGALVVDITAGDVTAEVRNNGGTIEVLNGSAALQACAPDTPTTANTGSITMNDLVAGQSSLFFLDLSSGALGPGTPVEGSGTSEIEVTINAGDGTADRLQVNGTTSPDIYRFGALNPVAIGANLDNDDDSEDVTFNNGERLNASGFAGADVIDASGGAGFAGPVLYDAPGSSAVRLNGGTENDTLKSGSGSSFLDGGSEDDTMTGGAAADEIELGTLGGNDTADGAGGSDFANYQFSPVGVLGVDLRITGQQDTGVGGLDTLSNFENLVGSQQAGGTDTLIGTSGPNQIFANDGNDTLIGLAGDDELRGGLGVDTASYTPGSVGPVSVNLGNVGAQATGGAGTDTLPDLSPNDGLSDIENLVGSPFAGDVLTGSAGPNRLDVRDGFGDSADCVGPANGNLAVTDEPGVDTVVNCETIDALPPTPPPDMTPGGSNSPGTGVPDIVPPETIIGSHPKSKTRKRTATFTFASSEPGSSFRCSYDGKPAVPCGPSFTTPKLRRGKHRFDVQATDTAGNGDLTAATFSWKIVKPKRQ